MSGRYSARGVDKDPGWVERRFREQDQRLAELSTGKLSSVPGSVVTIQQFLTNPSASVVGFINTDAITVSDVGDAILTLTHTPIGGSEHVRWCALDVPRAEWSRDGKTLTVLDIDGAIKVGDSISCSYAYDPTAVDPVSTTPTGALVEYESAGWKYIVILRTDDTDYSASAFDDSAWATGAAPFGDMNGGILDWPDPATTWETVSRMWARRTFAATAGVDLTIRARIEWGVVFYLNGVEVGSATPHATEMTPIIVPGEYVLASNVLAVQVTDNTIQGQSYFDMEVSQ